MLPSKMRLSNQRIEQQLTCIHIISLFFVVVVLVAVQICFHFSPFLFSSCKFY